MGQLRRLFRVFNQDASFDPTQTLTITATTGGVCGLGNFNKTPSSLGVAGNPLSLILTNTARLKGPNGQPLTDPSNATQLADFRTLLNTFAAHAAVQGIVVDLANDNGLQADYAQWDSQPGCVPAVNLVSEAIHDLLAKYRSQPGSILKYVTIAGGHTVLPYRLTPDHAEIQPEKRYNPGVLDQSESAATLGSDYVMSDSYYISFTPISFLESEINLPEAGLGVGRLVETSDDITNVLQAFLANNGILTPGTALASGYTFVKDLATFEAAEFTKSGLTTDDKLISDTWTMPDLKGKIFAPGARFDILALNWHSATNVAVAADYSSPHPTVLTTADFVNLTPDQRFNNILVMSIGCHLGYNLVNSDVIGQAQNAPVTDPRDFTQVLANQGAMVLGNTGYGYGDTNFMGYSERLLGIITQELEYTDYGAAVPVGLALTRAKRNYVDGAATLTGVDKKAVEQLTFYGPPMWSVAMPIRSPRPTVTPISVHPVTRGAGLSAGDVTPPYKLTETELGDGFDRYFSADSGTVSNNNGTETLPFRPVQPLKGFDVSNAAGTARGVALITADYQDLGGFQPLVNRPVTEEAGRTQTPNSHGLTPFMPFGTNELIGQSLVVMPFQWTSTGNGAGSFARRYLDSGLQLRPYYSSTLGAAALAGPAAIGNVAVTANGSLVHVDATITGATVADIADVLVSYTAVGTNLLHDASGHGRWVSCNLVPGVVGGPGSTASCLNARLFTVSSNSNSFVRHYSADIETAAITGAAPTDLRLLIQTVTGTGLVSVGVNDGSYFKVSPSATVSTPKKPTVVTLAPPTSPSPYDHSATFSAALKQGGQPIDGQIVFTVGSQRQVAATVGGTATTHMVIQELPGDYQVTAAFIETPTLLGSSASASIVVAKKATSLAFGATPFLVTLKDADGNLLRDETVFINVDDGAGSSQTLAEQTSRDGVAQLRGLTVPAGSYTVIAYFLGTVPFDTGRSVVLTDDRYAPARVRSTLTFSPDAPACDLTNAGIDGQGRVFIQVTVSDAVSGLASVSTTELNNATVDIPSFTNGLQAPLIVTATKIDRTQGSQLGLEVVNVAGNVTDCDPVAVTIGGRGEPRSATVHNVKPAEHFVVIYNGKPGLRKLRVKVNQRTWQVLNLRPGEVRTLDIAQALKAKGHNTVTVTAEGPPAGSAMVLISDRAPASAIVRHAQAERSAPAVDTDAETDNSDTASP